jgi:2,4-dienoyl-CoA reductase-like NADH-dependent reductase (Old Yellow Enzyme family)
VTKSVHAKKGVIYAQLTHHGRYALPQFTSFPTVSASATPFSTDEKYAYPPPGTNTRVHLKDYPPIELSLDHLQATIADYVRAAEMAMEAGFDGVEIHGGNGYLVEQFLSSNVNVRIDDYGGSPEKRCKFAIDLVAAVGAAIGIHRVAIRLSPFGIYGDMHDSQRYETWSCLCKRLREVSSGKLSYVSFIEARNEDIEGKDFEQSWGAGRKVGLGWARECLGPHVKVFSAGGWDGESVWGGLEKGEVAGFVFARWFVSNPDLVER